MHSAGQLAALLPIPYGAGQLDCTSCNDWPENSYGSDVIGAPLGSSSVLTNVLAGTYVMYLAPCHVCYVVGNQYVSYANHIANRCKDSGVVVARKAKVGVDACALHHPVGWTRELVLVRPAVQPGSGCRFNGVISSNKRDVRVAGKHKLAVSRENKLLELYLSRGLSLRCRYSNDATLLAGCRVRQLTRGQVEGGKG